MEIKAPVLRNFGYQISKRIMDFANMPRKGMINISVTAVGREIRG